jgi:Transglycosylase SLT domain
MADSKPTSKPTRRPAWCDGYHLALAISCAVIALLIISCSVDKESTPAIPAKPAPVNLEQQVDLRVSLTLERPVFLLKAGESVSSFVVPQRVKPVVLNQEPISDRFGLSLAPVTLHVAQVEPVAAAPKPAPVVTAAFIPPKPVRPKRLIEAAPLPIAPKPAKVPMVKVPAVKVKEVKQASIVNTPKGGFLTSLFESLTATGPSNGKQPLKGSRGSGGLGNCYTDLTSKYANQYGINHKLWQSVLYYESRCKPKAYNASGATGLGQIKRESAALLGYTGTQKALYKPDINLRYSAIYIKKCQDRYASGQLVLPKKYRDNKTAAIALCYVAGHNAKKYNSYALGYARDIINLEKRAN